MSLTYQTYVSALTTMMVTSSTNQAFVAILPDIIDYAEQRCYRELDLLATVTTDASKQLSAGSRSFILPTASATFVTVQDVNVVTPAGYTPDAGQRNPLMAVSKEFLDSVYNSSSGSGVPLYFAMLNSTTIIVGPWPDQAYTVEIVGTIRPAPLSVSNTSTFLSTYLPDLFLAASMVFASGYQKNFGSQSDDPKMAMSWEDQYQKLMASANAEELRKKWAGPGWTSLSAVAAQPVR